VRRGYLDFPWGQIHYRTARADPALPLLLILHQSPLSARGYDRLLPLLAGSVRPYALDTPGYGSSDPGPAGWQVADYTAAFLACADRLGARGPGAPFHLFGRATGALFAAVMAIHAPDRLRSLVLHGLPVYTDAERADRLANFAPPYALDAEGGHLGWIWRRIKGEYPWMDPDLATRATRDYLDAGPDFASSYRAIWRYNLRAAVPARWPVPTLLVAGSEDRIGFMHERARALLPAAETAALAGATDFVAYQEPERLAAVLLGFLARHGCGRAPSPAAGD